MLNNKIVENTFFFGLLAAAAYLVWGVLAPFAGAVALAAVIVTICYPLHTRILKRMPTHTSLAAFFSVIVVFVIIFVPLTVIATILLNEAHSIYVAANSGSPASFQASFAHIEKFIQAFVPNFSLDITGYISKAANSIASNLGAIFASTAATIFFLLITLIGTFYFFRDGQQFSRFLIELSPLPDHEDKRIVERLATSIRAVAVGSVLVALIQGILTAIGLSIFGFKHAVLWGSVASIGALIPGVGTSIVFIPAVAYLIITGSYFVAVGVAIWGTFAVGLIDNFVGPYLMSRAGSLHPYLILLAVLGGIAFFGPVGFVLGPVVFTLFLALIELYSLHIKAAEQEEHG
jgi:predicted PurR-regulated permease PerM